MVTTITVVASSQSVELNRHTVAVIVTLCCMQESYAMSMCLLCNGKFIMSLGAAVLTFNKQLMSLLWVWVCPPA